MKAYQITGKDGLASLERVELEDPTEPQRGEITVRVRACSLNYRDSMNVMGLHGISGPLPRIPCSDAAGEVLAVGPDCGGWLPGQRVVIPFMPTWLEGEFSREHSAAALGGACDGVLREFITLPATSIVPLPDGISLDAASTLPCAAVTAWQALRVRRPVKAGETVLILGSGGVSIFALQLAKAAGARVLATTSCPEKAARLRALGADAVHQYRNDPAWDEWALAQTGGVGVDHVVEIGGAQTLNRSLHAVRFGGHIALIGVLTGTKGEINTVQVLRKGIDLNGIYVGSRAMLADVVDAMGRERWQPVIDGTYEFDQAIEAFRRLESGLHVGKLVIRV